MQQYLDRARLNVKRVEYKAAIDFYDKVIARAPTAQYYNERSQCHLQLFDLEAALKDAKAMIKLANNDPLGYLRAGDLLLKMGKDGVALDVMSHGLKRVKHAGKSYEDLHSAHTKLLSVLVPEHSVDPLTVLPREVALMVLQLLTFRQRVATMRVSKGWYGFMQSSSDLWRHLDFSNARRPVRTSAVRRYTAFARKSVTQLTLGDMSQFDLAMRHILQTCPVTDVNAGPNAPALLVRPLNDSLLGIKRLRSLRIVQDIDPGMLRRIIEAHHETLEELVLPLSHGSLTSMTVDLPTLTALELVCVPDHGSVGSIEYSNLHLDRKKQLRRLKLDTPNCRFRGPGMMQHLAADLEHLIDLEIPLSHLRLFRRASSTVRALRIDCDLDRTISHWLHNNDRTMDPGHLYDFPNLEDLRVRAVYRNLHLGIKQFAAMFQLQSNNDTQHVVQPLKHLWLENTPLLFQEIAEDETDSILRSPRLTRLETLHIDAIPLWSDEHMEVVASTLTSLQDLVISGSVKLTGVGIKAVMQLKSLRSLHIYACENISPDALAWARAQPIKFIYRANRVL